MILASKPVLNAAYGLLFRSRYDSTVTMRPAVEQSQHDRLILISVHNLPMRLSFRFPRFVEFADLYELSASQNKHTHYARLVVEVS